VRVEGQRARSRGVPGRWGCCHHREDLGMDRAGARLPRHMREFRATAARRRLSQAHTRVPSRECFGMRRRGPQGERLSAAARRLARRELITPGPSGGRSAEPEVSMEVRRPGRTGCGWPGGFAEPLAGARRSSRPGHHRGVTAQRGLQQSWLWARRSCRVWWRWLDRGCWMARRPGQAGRKGAAVLPR